MLGQKSRTGGALHRPRLESAPQDGYDLLSGVEWYSTRTRGFGASKGLAGSCTGGASRRPKAANAKPRSAPFKENLTLHPNPARTKRNQL